MPLGGESLGMRCPLRCLAAAVVLVAVFGCSPGDPPRQYSDEELELDEIIDDEMLVALPYAKYRTDGERHRDLPDLPTDPAVGSGHERERSYFEFLVGLVLLAAGDALPPDVALDSGVLHDAEDEAMDQCATEAGWPGVRLYDVSQDLGEQYEREFGLTLDQFLDLRHECSQYAANYPTLDPAYRDELLARRRAHYMTAVREWMEKNPELVVPVEYHEGANRPYEALLVKTCLESGADRAECAREKQVTLP